MRTYVHIIFALPLVFGFLMFKLIGAFFLLILRTIFIDFVQLLVFFFDP